jgi:hypothetical protein
MCFDDAFVSSLLYGFGVGTLTEQQTYRSKDDTLSSSRLTRYDGETGMQVYVERVDKCEVLDIQVSKHE